MLEKLNTQQAASAKKILEATRQMIQKAAKGNEEVGFRIRRYVRTRLEHDERGKPLQRKLMKLKKFAEQRGLCAVCGKPMTLEEEPHLHRIVSSRGYTAENTVLLHYQCHRGEQRSRGFK